MKNSAVFFFFFYQILNVFDKVTKNNYELLQLDLQQTCSESRHCDLCLIALKMS